MTIRSLNFVEIARSGAIGPVRIGASLAEIGPLVRTPSYWGFGQEDELWFYVGLGGVEVHFVTTNNMPRITYAEIQMHRFKKWHLSFLREKSGHETRIYNNFENRKVTYEAVCSTLGSHGIAFSEGFAESVLDGTSAAINVGPVHFYFVGADHPILELVSLS